MYRKFLVKQTVVGAALLSLVLTPFAAFGQTRVEMPKNKYKVADDVKLGVQAAAEVDRKFPLVNDSDAQRYVERIGANLVNSIPPRFQQSSFRYRFKLVNARDINAFALPGGPMYINRGMIQAAKNEGEMAGVMAHEISHVALRHATAQATETQKYQIGSVLGQIAGAVIGGGVGQVIGAGSQIGFGGLALKYSRSYETQADVLGSQIMADAGYDPRDLAAMFQTISRESRGGGPEWMSSHPNPDNRYQKINQEAQYLRVSNPIKITRDFERVKARLASMPQAPTLAEIERSGGAGTNNGQVNNPTAGGRYANNVEAPSTRTRLYNGVSSVSFRVPDNWRDFGDANGTTLAPEGAYGDQGITHGTLVGMYRAQNGVNLNQATEEYVQSTLGGNNYLTRRTGYSTVYINGRRGQTIQLGGRSPVTGRNELATIYTTTLRSGDLLYFVTVVPQNESGTYDQVFRQMINSVRLNDQN